MLRILNGTIQNFLTIGNVTQTIDLSLDGLTLVLGENLDIGGANSRNGCGKTGLLQAISYALFGKPLTKIRLDNLCNNINNKAMLVTLDFECHGKMYRIERGRKPAVLRFFKDGVLQKERDESQGESKHTQTEIERIVGMSYVMFRHIVGLNTSTTPFLREEASVQREVIEELFGITQLSQRAEALKRLIEITREQSRNAEATVKANGEANARITQAIDRAKDEALTWRTMQQRRIADLAVKAKALDAIDIDGEIAVFDRIDQWQQQQREIDGQRQRHDQQITSLSQEITRLRQEIVRHEEAGQFDESSQIKRLAQQAQSYRSETEQTIQPQIDRLQGEVDRRHREASDKDAEADRLASELVSVMERLAHPDAHKCSTCGQGLAGTNHLATVLIKLAEQREHLDGAITKLTADHHRAKQDASIVEFEIARIQETHQRHRAESLAKVATIQDDIEQAECQLAAKQLHWQEKAGELQTMLESAITTRQDHVQQRDTLPQPTTAPVSKYPSRDAVWQIRLERDTLVDRLDAELTRPNPIDAKIDGLQSTLVEIDYASVNELTLRFKHETFLLKLLTAKDSFIRKKIVDQNLTYLNKRLNHYLDRLRLPHEVVFKPDLTVEIALLGREFDFEQLSRGEMNRVILATAFSFRDVWENLNSALNLVFVDECLDTGMDGAGVEAALDILTAMAAERGKTVFLVSHREELRERIDHVMIVRKENQFTSFA